jgi:hypothetical protein
MRMVEMMAMRAFEVTVWSPMVPPPREVFRDSDLDCEGGSEGEGDQRPEGVTAGKGNDVTQDRSRPGLRD